MKRRLPTLRASALLACAFAVACADDSSTDPGGADDAADKGALPEIGGKDDGTGPVIRDHGGLFLSRESGFIPKDELVAWRVNAWPGTRLRVDVRAPDGGDPFVAVDGPWPSDPGKRVGFNDDADGLDSSLELTVDRAGAYRIVIGSFTPTQNGPGEGRGAPYDLEVTCLAQCSQPEITLDAVMRDLVDAEGAEAIRGWIEPRLAALFEDPASKEAIAAQITGALARVVNGGELGAFPVVPLSVAGLAQGLFETPEVAPEAPTAVTYDLTEILDGDCAPTRGQAAPLHPAVPALVRGGPADYTWTECGLQQAQAFAAALNNLALDNGSVVVNGDARYETVEAVVDALLASGHRIRMDNARYVANFMNLWYRDQAVIAPVWIDTGLEVSADEPLLMPAPHAHHNIYVTGPVVNTRLMFYMGIPGGVGFRVPTTIRPAWVGGAVQHVYDSDADADVEKVRAILSTASDLRQKWYFEGRDLPVEGYGQLGVCTDSTAILELVAEGTASLFPLAAPGSDGTDKDGIDQIIEALPYDLGTPGDDALNRIAATVAWENWDTAPIPSFIDQLRRMGTSK